MSEKIYLSSRDLISESLLRDLIVFSLFFVLILSQGWSNLLLLFFPIISFGFSIFFSVINANKWRSEFDNNIVIYNPFGSEKKNANRLNFCTLIQLILLFWYGSESLYHPQLVDNYYFYFISIFVFVYLFGFYWMFIDLWKYSKVGLILHGLGSIGEKLNDEKVMDTLEVIISRLNLKTYKNISILNFIFFISLNVLNLLFSLPLLINLFPNFEYNLPGTGFEDSEPITLTYLIYAIISIPPIITIIFIKISYSAINDMNKEKLNSILEKLPKNLQTQIIANLKSINKKFQEELRLE